MKLAKGPLFFLKSVLVLLALLALAFCIFAIPGMATRDAVAHPETAYLQYPFVLSAYLLFSLFFTVLYQTFKLLGYISKSLAFSTEALQALKKIKYCALTLTAFFTAGLIVLIFVIGGDIAGIFMMSLICIIASAAVGSFAGVLEKLTAQATQLKAENEMII